MIRTTLVTTLLAGCFAPDLSGEIRCGNHDECDSDHLCFEGMCRPSNCEALTDGVSCSTLGHADGICVDSTCVSRGCGNHFLEDGEECDGDNGCTTQCTYSVCGNGRLDVSERCDDGARIGHDGCSAACGVEIEKWERVEVANLIGRFHAVAVYDPRLEKTLMFGGTLDADSRRNVAELWEWSDHTWLLRNPTSSPSTRSNGAMYFDPAKQRTVLYGGLRGVAENEMWSWDGFEWTQIAIFGPQPSPRQFPAIAYDAQRSRAILYGGRDRMNVWTNETWEWDGATWTQLTPTVSPSCITTGARLNKPQIAYDQIHHVMLLRCGYLEGVNLRESVWTFDGATWSSTAITGGAALFISTMQGVAAVTAGGGVRIWNGATWDLVINASSNSSILSVAYDSTRNKIIGYGEATTDELDASASDSTLSNDRPDARHGATAVWDAKRGRMIMFGGRRNSALTNETWQLIDTTWTRVTTVTTPSPRAYAAMTYDPIRKRTLLFGGGDDQTWEFDGIDWVQRTTPSTPPPRSGASLAWDAKRNRALLFGGATNDTWVWDGDGWGELHPSQSPPPTTNGAMVYDAKAEKTVLLADDQTWLFDGSNWTHASPTTSPPGRSFANATYDYARGRVVISSGRASNDTLLSDSWEWTGSTWEPRASLDGSFARSGAAIAYDANHDRLLMFGGRGLVAFDDTWSRVFVPLALTNDETCDDATHDTDHDGEAGCDDIDCWGRCTPFCPPGLSCDPGDPRCGDGVCNPLLEDTRLCPMDCQ